MNEPGDRPAPRRYRCLGVSVTPLGEDKVSVYAAPAQATRVLSPFLARILLACRTFDTLPRHAMRRYRETLLQVTQAVPAGTEAMDATVSEEEAAFMEQRLAAFVEDGLLISEAAVHDQIRALAAAAAPGPAVPITVVGLTTRERPEALKRAVQSYLENLQRHERRARFLVDDDAACEAVRACNRKALEALQERFRVPVVHVDRQTRACFGEALAACTGVPAAVIRFALFGHEGCRCTIGAGRNALLLYTAGACSLQVDDDTVARVTAVPEKQPGLALTSRRDASAYWFFRDRPEALDAAEFVERDVLGLHERLLGRSLAACVRDAQDSGLYFDDISFRFLEHARLPEARVRISLGGTVGDSAMAGVPPYVSLEAPSYEAPSYEGLAARATHDAARIASREMIRGAPRWSVGDGPFCMTVNIGLDHRDLLPPFMPVQRDEDGLFGSLLTCCFPAAFKGYLPYAVLHAPMEARGGRGGSRTPMPAPPGTNELISWLVDAYATPRRDLAGPSTTLEALGRHLETIASLPPPGFAHHVQGVCHSVQLCRLASLEERRAGSDLPLARANDLSDYLAAAHKALAQPHWYAPGDLDGPPAKRMATLQALTHRFGTLLVHWPALFAGARALRTADATLPGGYLHPAGPLP